MVVLGSGHSSSDGPLAKVESSRLRLVNAEPCTPSVEKAMAPHFSTWKIPWTEEPGGLQSMGR